MEESIGNWCHCLSAKEVSEHLQTLAMKTSGSKFIKMNRLSQWLLGIYELEDFQAGEEKDEISVLIKREDLRSIIIVEQSKKELPPTWANITGDSTGEQHPLTILAEDETIKANLEAMRLAITEEEVLLQRQTDIVVENAEHPPNQQNSGTDQTQSKSQS